MWPIVVCNHAFQDRILASGYLDNHVSVTAFPRPAEEAQTMNKEHHALCSTLPSNFHYPQSYILVLHPADISCAQQRLGIVTRDGFTDEMVYQYKETSVPSHSFSF